MSRTSLLTSKKTVIFRGRQKLKINLVKEEVYNVLVVMDVVISSMSVLVI